MIIKRFKGKMSWNNILIALSEAIYLAAIFLTPLYFAFFSSSDQVFEIHKIFLLKIFLALLLLSTVIKEILFPARITMRIKKIVISYWGVPLIFILGLFVSIFFSDNLQLSFFGSVDRQQGFIAYLIYFAFFVLISFNLFLKKELDYYANTKRFIKSIFSILFSVNLSLFLVSVYALFQYIGLDVFSWIEPAYETGRTFSSLGQPNFLASFIVLTLPISVYLLLRYKRFAHKLFQVLVIFIAVLALISTSSRGGLIALILTLILFVLYLFFRKEFKISRGKKIIFFCLALFAALSFLFIVELASPGRITSIADLKSGSVNARMNYYSSAVLAIKERPFFGYGIENLYTPFASYYDSNWAIHSPVGQVPDRVHNILLDIMMTLGLYGLILYSVLISYIIFLTVKLHKDNNFKNISLALAFGLISYFLSLMFNFSFVSGEFYLFLYLAVFSAFYFDLKRVELEGPKTPHGINIYLKIVLMVLVLTLSSFIVFRSSKTIMADYYYANFKLAFSKGSFSEGLTFLDYIDELKLNEIAKQHYATNASTIILPLHPYQEEKALNYLIEVRLHSLNNDLKTNYPSSLVSKTKVQASLDLGESDYLLEKMKSDYSTWPPAILARARILKHQEKYNLAIESYQLLLDSLPSVDNRYLNNDHRLVLIKNRYDAYNSIAEIYESLNDYSAARKYYRLAYQEAPLNHSLLKKISDTLYREGSYSEALVEVQRGLRLSPNDYNWYVLTALLYQELGDDEAFNYWREKAVEMGYTE